MKRTKITRLYLTLVGTTLAALLVACDQSITGDDHTHDHGIMVEFSYDPDPAVVNAAITLKFSVEDEHGEHAAVQNPTCEIHGVGDVALAEGESGHYSGTHTFTAAGTYECHFSFTHEGTSFEEEFSITVGQ